MATHYNICNYLDGKCFSSLNAQMQGFINCITNGITGNPTIYCNVITDPMIKPNLDITINSTHYYISVLAGKGNSVHEEQPDDFINFLDSIHAPIDVQQCIHDLCYSPYHTSGFISNDFILHPSRIPNTRTFFSVNRIFFIDRALRTGIYGTQPSQFIYWGDVNYGEYKDINTVIATLCSYTASTSLIPAGGLVLQRKNRSVNHNIQFKWPNPSSDL